MQAAASLANEKGCLRFEIFRHPQESHRYYFHEVYADKAAVEEIHDKTPYLAAFRAACAPLVRGRERTEWSGVN